MNPDQRPTDPAAAASPRRKRLARRAIVVLAVVLLLGALGAWRYVRHNFKRFREIRPGVAYRMGQPSEYGLRSIAHSCGLRTIVCLRHDSPRLRTGRFFDVGEPSGPTEEDCATELGIRFLHWPLGEEVYWPWPSPWHLQQFYRLYDDPAHWPVLVHCRAGKHRAGTFAALFRLEYDRWDAERVLEEMYSFRFGTPQTIQEHNLRTYLPRPRPDPDQWGKLLSALGDVPGLKKGISPICAKHPPGRCAANGTYPLFQADYEALVRRLRAVRDRPGVEAALESYVAGERPFAVCLAGRLIGGSDDRLAPVACGVAARCLANAQAAPSDWAASAALVADFGTPEQQQALLALLEEEAKTPEPTPRYRAVVAGVTNRYARHRVRYLRPLLWDLRPRPETAARQYRYADTAVARLTSIENVDLLGVHEAADRAAWDRGIEAARAWFAASQTSEVSKTSEVCPP